MGLFQAHQSNHPTNLMSEMKSTVRSLLDLPMDIKRLNTNVIHGSGYVAPTKNNPFYESFDIYDSSSPEDVSVFCNQLDVSAPQRETIMKYSQCMHEWAMDIGQKLAKSMNLSTDLFNEWTCQTRINKYNFTPESVGSSGVQIHTDPGFLTILQVDENVGGLEGIDKATSAYLPVDPMPSSLLVNLGDVATVWSNGRSYNVNHRVQFKEASIRVSIAFFVLGPKKEAVEAPEELVDSQRPWLFLPLVFEDYRQLRLSTGLLAGEALFVLLPKNRTPK